MARSLRFVTGNAGKLREAKAALAPLAVVEQDAGGYAEVQADSLEEVARFGLGEVARRLEPPFFLEDAGLFVDALEGFPGVYSAYAYRTIGCAGVLRLLADVPAARRGARFESVVAYRDAGGVDRCFSGVCRGWIREAASGTGGFGFDPVFAPATHAEGPAGPSFAELGVAAKNLVSHRGRALAALRAHLEAETAHREKAS